MDIVSVNLGNAAHNVTALQQRAQLGRLARSRPDVIVTQEARSGWLTPLGYRAMPVAVGGASEDRIVVRKGHKITAHGYIRLHPGREHMWPARSLPFVGLDDDMWIVGMHLNSNIERGGEFVAGGDRRAFTSRAIRATADFARFVHARLGGRVVVIGDTNVHAYADRRERDAQFPTVRFGAAGLREVLPGKPSGTLGSRRVDRVWVTDLPSLTGPGVSVRDLAKRAPYDHQPIALHLP